jgi:hypothetical protein
VAASPTSPAAEPRSWPQTDVALTGASVIVVVTSLAVEMLLLMIRTHRGLANWDRGAAEWGAAHATATSTSILKVVTQLGGTVVVVLIGAPVAVVETVRSRRPAGLGFLVAVFPA